MKAKVMSCVAVILLLAAPSCKKQKCCQTNSGNCITVKQEQFPGGRSEFLNYVNSLEDQGFTCNPN